MHFHSLTYLLAFVKAHSYNIFKSRRLYNVWGNNREQAIFIRTIKTRLAVTLLTTILSSSSGLLPHVGKHKPFVVQATAKGEHFNSPTNKSLEQPLKDHLCGYKSDIENTVLFNSIDKGTFRARETRDPAHRLNLHCPESRVSVWKLSAFENQQPCVMTSLSYGHIFCLESQKIDGTYQRYNHYFNFFYLNFTFFYLNITFF